MRKRSLSKTVDSDLRILEWFDSNPDRLEEFKSPYIKYYESITVGNFNVTRNTYGGTQFTYSIKYGNKSYPTHAYFEMPITDNMIVPIDNYKKGATDVILPILNKTWGKDMPTFNRKCDNWLAAIIDHDKYLDRWRWIKESESTARNTIRAYLRGISSQEEFQEAAHRVESNRALDRLVNLQKEYKHLSADYWHTLVDMSIVHNVHI